MTIPYRKIPEYIKPVIKVSFWGVKCWFNPETDELIGINRFYDLLVPVAVWFQDSMAILTNFFCPDWESPGFRFKIISLDQSQEESLKKEIEKLK